MNNGNLKLELYKWKVSSRGSVPYENKKELTW